VAQGNCKVHKVPQQIHGESSVLKKKNDQKMVCQVRKTIAKVYKGVPYSPNLALVETALGQFMFTLPGQNCTMVPIT